MSAALLAQLFAVRAQVDAIIVGLQAQMGAPAQETPKDPKSCPECGAPEDRQAKAPSMSGIRIRCLDCGQERTEPARAPQTTL